jgi:hypothetical protein
MSKTILVTGASSGFGAMTVRTLADAGHLVYAGIRDTAGRNQAAVNDAAAYAKDKSVRLRTVELDVSDQQSVDAGVARILADADRIDVVVHNAGHMVLGPAEAFTPEQLIEVYDTNVISTQRVNRAVPARPGRRAAGLGRLHQHPRRHPALPRPLLRRQGGGRLPRGQLRGRAGPVRHRHDHRRPRLGSFTTGTNHFAHAGHPADTGTADAYESRYAGLMDEVSKRLATLAPADADPSEVARQIARVVDLPKGQRPFRVHIDPANDGAETVNNVSDLVREHFYHRIGLDDLLTPALGG